MMDTFYEWLDKQDPASIPSVTWKECHTEIAERYLEFRMKNARAYAQMNYEQARLAAANGDLWALAFTDLCECVLPEGPLAEDE